MEHFGGGFVLVENRIDGVDEGRADADPVRGLVDGKRVRNSLCDHAEGILSLLE